jgi:hypothetical protein
VVRRPGAGKNRVAEGSLGESAIEEAVRIIRDGVVQGVSAWCGGASGPGDSVTGRIGEALHGERACDFPSLRHL